MDSMIELNDSLNEIIKGLNTDITELHEENKELIKKNDILYERIVKLIDYASVNLNHKNEVEIIKILLGK